MILRYLKGKNKIQPELQKKAEGLINTGYQSLIAYEVPGGGYSWYGKAPAVKTLTAYGLLEFSDMKAVYPIDENIIERTQSWLASQQNSDGSFSFDSTHGYGSSNDENSALLSTAYITWALMESGYRGRATERGLAYLGRHLERIDDPYILALTINAFGLSDRSSGDTRDLCRKLESMAKVQEDRASWRCNYTVMHGCGEAGTTETTALAAQALLRFGSDTQLAQKALNYLIATRGAGGSWGSTQATVLALRTLTEAEGKPGRQSGQIAVSINGKVHTTFNIKEETSDVLQMADLRDEVRTGDNTIELRCSGTGTFTYQVAGKYYLPWKKEKELTEKPLSIDVHYDRTTLSSDDTVKVTAMLQRKGASSPGMVIADLGVPPGFTVITEDLEKMKDSGIIQRYELTSRQIILYLMEVKKGQMLIFSYRMKARFPLRAKSPASAVYEYYNPRVRAESPPQQITVK